MAGADPWITCSLIMTPDSLLDLKAIFRRLRSTSDEWSTQGRRWAASDT